MISCQGSIQTKLRPATWIPGIRNPHSEVQSWTFDADVATSMKYVWEAANDLTTTGYIPRVFDKDTEVIVVDCLTKNAKWMDQLRFAFKFCEEGKTDCQVFGSSTGFLPLIFPLAPVLNVFLCWIPFLDQGVCGKEMGKLGQQVETKFNTSITIRVMRYSNSNPKKKTISPNDG
uniref:Uncharacterized protein n=1 Tax=Mucochytrium quahogii TaxID=96639 RepID=A0A7S2RFA6_9STRA|mmetsp:Transcript_116/g.270  ORF Transcript_116/g.270 Transcript_116/m.270 type:complete len:174 (-) Transcript_116:976-1497(-)